MSASRVGSSKGKRCFARQMSIVTLVRLWMWVGLGVQVRDRVSLDVSHGMRDTHAHSRLKGLVGVWLRLRVKVGHGRIKFRPQTSLPGERLRRGLEEEELKHGSASLCKGPV